MGALCPCPHHRCQVTVTFPVVDEARDDHCLQKNQQQKEKLDVGFFSIHNTGPLPWAGGAKGCAALGKDEWTRSARTHTPPWAQQFALLNHHRQGKE